MPDGHLVLQTLRSHDQFNTTIYGLSDRYRGIEGGRRVIFVHRDDIAALGFDARRPRRPRHALGRTTTSCACAPSFRIVEYDTPRGSRRGVLPGDQPAGAARPHRDGAATRPAYKSVIVRLVPAARAPSAPATGAGQDPAGSDWTHKSDPEPKHLS